MRDSYTKYWIKTGLRSTRWKAAAMAKEWWRGSLEFPGVTWRFTRPNVKTAGCFRLTVRRPDSFWKSFRHAGLDSRLPRSNRAIEAVAGGKGVKDRLSAIIGASEEIHEFGP